MAKKKVTIAQIAEKLGISQATVSFVLNGKEMGLSESTRAKVIELAEELGYKKLPRANLPEWTRVAYLSSNIEFFNYYTSFFAGVYSHLQKRASERKMELSLLEFRIDGKADEVYKRFQELRSLNMDVFLTNNIAIAEYLMSRGMKVILVQGGTLENCLCVHCDDYNAGRLAARYAIQNGHRKAGTIFFEGALNSPRYAGFMDEYLWSGGECLPQFHWVVPGNHFEAEVKLSELIVKQEEIPSFFYCFADNIMFPAIRAFYANGYKVPWDVSLVGTDNLYWGRVASPSFTTVDLNEELFADKLAEAVEHIKKGGLPYQLAVPVKLIERETVINR